MQGVTSIEAVRKIWALLPLKCLADAKQRLAGVLAPDERLGLSEAMVHDVLSTLTQCADLDGVVLLSPDPQAQQLAASFDCEYWSEKELGATGLNPALDAAVARLAAAGIDDVLIVHGDLPLFDSEALSALLKTHLKSEQPALTIATDRHGSGSNAVLCSPASQLKCLFGPDSLRLHIAEARDRGMITNIQRLPGLSLDIDTPEDFRLLLEARDNLRDGYTARYLGALRPGRSYGCGYGSDAIAGSSSPI